MTFIKLDNDFVGDSYPCYIIAEIGGLFKNFEEAKRLIDSAIDIGVNAVKFQTLEAETITSKNNFFDLTVTGHVSQYEFFKQFEPSKELQKQIVNYANKKGITVFSAPSHIQDLILMQEMDLQIYKIGSDLACHIPLLKKVANFSKPIILSTGMCTLDEVKKSVDAITNEGNNKLILLHCVSDYPSKIEELNLNVISEMKAEFNVPVGFSDHSIGSFGCLFAATMGANIIEKHMKHPKNSPCADDLHALNPKEFSELIKSIRLSESAKGSGKKTPTISEQKNLQKNRVSIITIKEIKKGTKISSEMIDIRRPGSGLSPSNYDDILTKIAKLDISKDTPLTWDLLE
jgi:N-acetylneuraminate synthase|tara:strand:+ start:430 stop:1464 length:1035 start_codon:yes stop_codon:yes gene_type:complete